MSSTADSIATPLVRGVLGALTSLGIAVAVVVVPALAAQVAGTASTATALDAIIISLNLLILGHGGGIMLSTGVIDGAVTLTPFGLLILLMLLSAGAMRRVGRALRPVRDDGVLRTGALRDVGSALGMYALVYAIGLAVLASIGRSADSSPMVTSAVASGAMVAVTGGLIGLLWSLRREPTETVPGVRVLDLLPAPYGDIARSSLLAVTGLLGVGMAVVVVMLALSVPAQSALFDGLAPGPVGGLVLTLVQIALLPLLAVWALSVVLGGTVGVGTATGISLTGAETGVLPALPMLGALPGPGPFPGGAWALMVLPAIPVALGAVRLVRDVAALEQRERITAWVAYPLVVTVSLLLLAGLSTGGIGDGRLVHLGPQMSTLALPLIGIVVLTTAAVLGVLATPLIPWTREAFRSVRERVEAAERTERGADAERAEGTATTDAGGTATTDAGGPATESLPYEHDDAEAVGAAQAADAAAAAEPAAPGRAAESQDPSAAEGRADTVSPPKGDAAKGDAASSDAAKTDAASSGAASSDAEENVDLEPDAWSLDAPGAADSAEPGSWISRRTDR